ncbi:MAG: lipoyl(octanoyl) transferase LipB [Euryarchaeota archaeon]|jgi:lipoyl(octanoyl) transferase|nr:lipoyl(octanoyl) transferase LipB [Euryarchaeota archaeon]
MRKFDVIRAGIIPHELVAKEMLRLQQLRITDDILDTLILVEHPEVVTIGPRARNEGVKAPQGYESTPIDRGGGLTWHGPGQLVAYPIFKWDLEGESNVAAIINLLERWIINSIRPIGINAYRDERMQGVWFENQKFSSIGLNFLKWVSRHGFTINYNTPTGRVENLASCGLETGTTTSLCAIGETGITRESLEALLIGSAIPSINREIGTYSTFSILDEST